MKNKINSHIKNSKRLNPLVRHVRQKGLPVVFVLAFALVGSWVILRSRAAAGNDLVVTNVTMTPSNPTPGQTVTFAATVRNQGTTPTPAGTVVGVGFLIDGQKVTWNQTNTSSLAAGASITLTANAGVSGPAWTATTGPHTLRATADETNAIPDEVDEANNSRNLIFTVGNTGRLYTSPATASVLVNNNVSLDIRLTPNTTVDGVEARLTYDATRLQFVSIDSAGSPFDVELGPQTGANGTVSLARGNLSGGVSADSLVAKVTFRALGNSGNTTLQLSGNASKGGVYTNPVSSTATISFTAPDTAAPTVTITSPTNGATVFMNQTINATASDNVGVVRLELYIDGQLRGTDTTSPYSFAVDTNTLTNGAHSIQVRGFDAAGNVGTSNTVTVTVKNWPEDINQDGKVDLLDFSLLASKYGQTGANLGRADINRDGSVTLLDFSLLASKYGQ